MTLAPTPDWTTAQDHDPGRRAASTGGPVFEYMKAGMSGSDTDPIFATKGRLMVNWWYSNNGARIALEDGSHYNGLLPKASPKNRNDDDVHGLGNEFGASTSAGKGSGAWWHDAAQKMTGDCHGGTCKMIGKDHGTNLKDGDYYGNYAIYLSSESSNFPCEGVYEAAQVWESGKGALAMKQVIFAGLSGRFKKMGFRKPKATVEAPPSQEIVQVEERAEEVHMQGPMPVPSKEPQEDCDLRLAEQRVMETVRKIHRSWMAGKVSSGISPPAGGMLQLQNVEHKEETGKEKVTVRASGSDLLP
eukprot:s87_g14.t2